MKDKPIRLEAGAPIKKNDWLVADPEGRAVPTRTWYGAYARALEDAETGDLFRVNCLLSEEYFKQAKKDLK